MGYISLWFMEIKAFFYCHFLRNKVGDPISILLIFSFLEKVLYDLTLGEENFTVGRFWRKRP